MVRETERTIKLEYIQYLYGIDDDGNVIEHNLADVIRFLDSRHIEHRGVAEALVDGVFVLYDPQFRMYTVVSEEEGVETFGLISEITEEDARQLPKVVG